MHIRRLLLGVLLLLLATAPSLYGSAEQPGRTVAPRTADVPVGGAADGKVHAVLFWLQGCGYCKQVMTEVIPPLQAKYGDKLQVQTVELTNAESSARFDRLVAALGLKSTDVGVPFLLIGDHVLMGSMQIPAQLPILIEQYLAAGGVDYPNLPGLENIGSLKTAKETAPKANGFELAWLVMALLLLSVLYAVVAAIWSLSKQRVVGGLAWLDVTVPVLAVAGLLIAFYLSYVETTRTIAVCGPVGDCNAVQASSYSRLFGVLPVGVFGLLGYVAILIAWAWARRGRDILARYAPLAIALMCFFGVAFTIYLTYLELLVLKAVCMWCLASAVIMALLLVVSTGPALASVVRPAVAPARAAQRVRPAVAPTRAAQQVRSGGKQRRK